jgi:hypothetical protein
VKRAAFTVAPERRREVSSPRTEVSSPRTGGFDVTDGCDRDVPRGVARRRPLGLAALGR